ncbi:MAG: YciI family protein [Planctomycetota bacterium]|jgi:uncharacterized protein YndB with AHSA1/START domain/uncharacterized protein YciI
MLTTTLTMATLLLPQSQEAPETLSIDITRKIETSPAELFRIFSTSEGVRTLFPGADAWIGEQVGELYHIAFMPGEDPKGERFGTAGCKIREKSENERLVFEWRGPEQFSEMNIEPFPTWVEVDISPDPNNPSQSQVHLQHHGFQANETWDEYQAWFTRAWQGSFDILELRYAAKPSADRSKIGEPAGFILASLTPGPAWKPGKPTMAQPKMANHAAYMMALLEKGELFMAGPLASETEGFLIINSTSWKRARNLLNADPAVQAGTFVFELKEWKTSLPQTHE